MMVANVVPLRRMPTDRPWLSYQLPAESSAQIGQLVSITLRGKSVTGIVWSITEEHDVSRALLEIGSPIVTPVVMTPWQRRVIDVVADCSSTSLSEIVLMAWPKLTERTIRKTFVTHPLPNAQPEQSSTMSGTLWYADRLAGLQDLVYSVRSATKQSTLILTPTEDDAMRIIHRLADQGYSALLVHQRLNAKAKLEVYIRVLRGEQIIIVGDLSALLLPWPQAPLMYLDQEDHPGHKFSAHYPHYDVRVILEHLGVTFRRSTVAPPVATADLYQAPPDTHQRQLISLLGTNAAPFVSEALLSLIDDTIDHQGTIVCIAPRRGFASATLCRACNQALACPQCHRRVSLVRGLHAEARCLACKTTIPLALSCANCGATSWHIQGLGVEYCTQALGRLRPEARIASAAVAGVEADIIVDTYQAYQQLSERKDVRAICILNGDSMLSAPDFSVSERAWQYVHRIAATSPQATLAVQTFEEQSTFWQRWLHHDHEHFYADERHQRQRLRVPPAVRQWIVSGHVSTDDLTKKIEELERLDASGVEVRRLPSRLHTPTTYRLLITFSSAVAEEQVQWQSMFPWPWHIDRFPTSWLD